MFIKSSEQIISVRLLLASIGKGKNIFSSKFKLKSIKTCHLEFVVKAL